MFDFFPSEVVPVSMWLCGNDMMTGNKHGIDGWLMTKSHQESWMNLVFTFPASTDRLSAPIIWRSGVERSFWIRTHTIQTHIRFV